MKKRSKKTPVLVSDKRTSVRWRVLVAVGLVLLTLLAMGSLGQFDFICFDDSGYVTNNSHVLTGLTPSNLLWALTTGRQCNWHPLTWWSHMLDAQCFGRWAGGHHLTSLLLHLANSVLVFVLLERMTEATWRSAMVAALFAIHPLHVESVAWVAERKDVLSTFFGLWTMLAYVAYIDRPSRMRYALVAGLLALGLMAKPMLVTLPCVLLLLDYWPLGRLASQPGSAWPQQARRLVLEKMPLLAIVVASCVITYLVQKHGGALKNVSFLERSENSLVSYVGYLRKGFWPMDLAVFYPWPEELPLATVVAAGLFLVAVTVAVLVAAKRGFHYAAVGWFWYLGTLVPVIGLVQVGEQAMADRYSYLPLVGIFILVVWGAHDLVGRYVWGRRALAVLGGVVLLNCLVITTIQVQFWRNTETLMRRVLEVSPRAWAAHNSLGDYYWQRYLGNRKGGGQWLELAVVHWKASLAIWSDSPVFCQLGHALQEQGRFDEAAASYREALAIKPRHADAHNDLGWILMKQGHQDEAIPHFQEAIAVNPDHVEARGNMALVLLEQGNTRQAIEHLREILRIDPQHTGAAQKLEELLKKEGSSSPPGNKGN